MKKILIVFLLLVSSCSRVTSVGSSYAGFDEVPGVKIQPEQAIELAKEHIDETYELRSKGGSLNRSHWEPRIFVTLKGDYYYIVKESYPAISIYFYLNHAVRVHVMTGEVIAPE